MGRKGILQIPGIHAGLARNGLAISLPSAEHPARPPSGHIDGRSPGSRAWGARLPRNGSAVSQWLKRSTLHRIQLRGQLRTCETSAGAGWPAPRVAHRIPCYALAGTVGGQSCRSRSHCQSAARACWPRVPAGGVGGEVPEPGADYPGSTALGGAMRCASFRPPGSECYDPQRILPEATPRRNAVAGWPASRVAASGCTRRGVCMAAATRTIARRSGWIARIVNAGAFAGLPSLQRAAERLGLAPWRRPAGLAATS